MATYSQNKAKDSAYKLRSSTTNQQYWDVTKGKYATPQFADANTMNAGYGLTIDRDKYLGQLDDRARTADVAARGLLAANENSQYAVMRQNQQAAMDVLNRSQGTGGLAGQSAGANSATALQAALGMNQQNVGLQTDLANAREQAALDLRAQLNSNAVDATSYVDTNLKSLMEQAGIRYSVDNDLLGQALTASGQYKGAKYTADQGLKGAKYTADKNLAGTKYTVNNSNKGGSYSSGTSTGNNNNNGSTKVVYKTTTPTKGAPGLGGGQPTTGSPAKTKTYKATKKK